MSLEIDLATLAEGVAADARGNLTLVAVNPNVLGAEHLPAQFAPILVVIVADDDLTDPIIVAGRSFAGRIEAVGPDGEVLFVLQVRQGVLPPAIPSVPPRLQVVAQVPFTATKTGDYRISAHIAVMDEGEKILGEITAGRTVRVLDATALRPA
jgi:hypothetical protein